MPPAQEVEDDEDKQERNNLTAEEAREARQLDALVDSSTSAAPVSDDTERQLALEAKLFIQLEAKEAAKKAEEQRLLSLVKIDPAITEVMIDQLDLNGNEAERLLRVNNGDLKKTILFCLTDFPQIELYRDGV